MKILTGQVRQYIDSPTSKSERIAYCLSGDFNDIPLYYKGDNPFENNILRPFEGCQVEVHGEFDRSTFVVYNIKFY